MIATYFYVDIPYVTLVFVGLAIAITGLILLHSDKDVRKFDGIVMVLLACFWFFLAGYYGASNYNVPKTNQVKAATK